MTELTFPDTELALFTLLDQFGQTYLNLTVDFESRLPGILIYKVGGRQSGPFREDRINVDVYAGGRDDARAVSEQIATFLTTQPRAVDGIGLLDAVRVDVTPHGVPYMSDTTSLFSTTYRVAVRGA